MVSHRSAVVLVALSGCTGVVEEKTSATPGNGGADGSGESRAGAPAGGGASGTSGGWTGQPEPPSSGGAGATGAAGATTCTSIASDGAPVPVRRLTATQVERTLADVLGVQQTLDVTDERLLTYRSNISTSVDAVSARGYFDFATAAVAKADLERCETSCLPWLLDEVGLRLFRRPLGASERERYGALFELGSQDANPEEGAAWVLEAMLQSPAFLYLDEVTKPDGTLDDYSMASRLSLLLWGSNPDPALLARAERGELSTREQVRAEVKRLLDDPRSREGLREFVDQWLELERLDDPDVRPDVAELGGATIRAMRDEPVELFRALLHDGAGLNALLTSSRTLASAPLEALYGSDIVERSSQTYELDPERRGGLLSMPGVIAALSHARRTSPTLRGRAVLANFLCSPPPPPPAGVSVTLPEVGPDVTTRERLELHMSDPACASCHRSMDGIGFALERLDWVGRFRDEENGHAIDDRSTFALSGSDITVSGAAELGARLAEDPGVAACVARQWLRYSLGVPESRAVECLVERLASEIHGERGLEAMIVTALTSDWFRMGPEETP